MGSLLYGDVSVMFFIFVGVAEWPPFKMMCQLGVLFVTHIFVVFVFHFSFTGRIVGPVPGHCEPDKKYIKLTYI